MRRLAWLALALAFVARPARAQTVGAVLGRGSCDRPADIMPLARQITETHLCRFPGDLESWAGLGHVRVTPYYTSTVLPYARPDVVAALRRVGAVLSVNSGFRSVLQQYVMRSRSPGNGCFGRLAAPPGGTHANGCAVDVQNHAAVRSAMTGAGFRWWGSSDPVHFGLVGCPGESGAASSTSHNDVAAFQFLWNANNPGDRIPVNGAWDGTTVDRMNRSPINGFARNGCAEDRDADGSPEGEDCDDLDPSRRPGGAESCDARDNDCDPAIDEGVARDCGSDVGECVTGWQTCSVGAWSACVGEVAPVAETCDILDNDCDGETDEERICEHEDAALARSAFGRQSTDLDGDGRADACVWQGLRLECIESGAFGFDRRIAGPTLHSAAHASLRAADLDGDGRDDVLAVEGDRALAWLSRGDRFESARVVLELGSRSPGSSQLELWMTDVDGDGRADACVRDIAGLRCTASASASLLALSALSDARGFDDVAAHGSIRFGDVDGDGRDDVCARIDGRLACWLAIADTTGERIEGPRWDDAEGWGQPGHLGTWRLVDLEGDGRADVCVRAPDGFGCWRSEGRSFGGFVRGPSFAELGARAGYATIRMGDIDGDGASDVCARTGDALRCWLFTGQGFEREIVGPEMTDGDGWTSVRQYESLRLADVSGDGRADVCARVGDQLVCWLASDAGFTRRWQTGASESAGLVLAGTGGRRVTLHGSMGCATGVRGTRTVSWPSWVLALAVLTARRRCRR